tara:strand:- start:134 stop:571 length:438 start_codon:yes stop_codon:yes gene_type:complete
MRSFFFKISYIFIFFVINSNLKIKADNYTLDNISGQNSELFIESNKQRSDLDNSVFYAEGDVIITNKNKEFIAKSKKAIFYKLKGKIKLSGSVEVFSGDMNKINAGEVIYYVKENKFEAISDENQKVKTKFFFNDNNLLNKSIEK